LRSTIDEKNVLKVWKIEKKNRVGTYRDTCLLKDKKKLGKVPSYFITPNLWTLFFKQIKMYCLIKLNYL